MVTRRIGIDARELLGARTGVGRYLGELMARWTQRSDAAAREFLLYSPGPLAIGWPRTTVRVVPGSPGTWWEQTSLASAVKADRPAVFFAPAYTAPVRLAAPLAVTIHDVSFSRHPEWFRRREGLRRRLLTKSAARRAGAVITVSEFSRSEIEALYGVPRARLHVVPNGLSPRSIPPASREPLVLYVGSIFNRRRVPDLVAAFAKVSAAVPKARLVIAGDNRTWPHEDIAAAAARHGVAKRVEVLAYVTDDQLSSLYARAAVFAFLSEYEGFGFTPLEALDAGVPIVVLDTPVAREIYSDAAIFVPRDDIGAAAGAIEKLLTSAEAASDVLARSPAVLSRYSWDVAADRTLAAIEGIAAR